MKYVIMFCLFPSRVCLYYYCYFTFTICLCFASSWYPLWLHQSAFYVLCVHYNVEVHYLSPSLPPSLSLTHSLLLCLSLPPSLSLSLIDQTESNFYFC